MTSTRKAALLLLCIGTLVAGFGSGRLVSALVAAPGDPVIAALNDDRPVSAAALDRLLNARRSAQAWSRSPGLYRDSARAGTIVAQRIVDDPASAASAFRQAAAATETGLRLAPVDPVSWLRLAAIRLNVDADPAAALTALRAAVRSGPYDPYRTEFRVRMALQLWSYLDASDRVLLQPQFRYLWQDDPAALARLALDERVLLIALAMLDDTKSAEALKGLRDEIRQSRP